MEQEKLQQYQQWKSDNKDFLEMFITEYINKSLRISVNCSSDSVGHIEVSLYNKNEQISSDDDWVTVH